MDILCLVGAAAVGIVASLAGGAISGIGIGGVALGKELAGFLGALYGVLAGAAGVILGLVILYFI